MYAKVLLGNPLKPDHQFTTGDGRLKSISISLEVDEIASNCSVEIFDPLHALADSYYKIIFDSNGLEPPVIDFNRLEPTADNVIRTVSGTQSATTRVETVNPNVKAGQQISIELGDFGQSYIRYEFLNDGIDYDFNSRRLIFKGTVASKIMTQYPKNSAYSNIKFRDLATQICAGYGLTASFEGDGPNPEYPYIPQIGQSDYQFLIGEARRIGYRVTTQGSTVLFKKAEVVEANSFTVEYGRNLTEISFSYDVEPTGSASVRASVGASNNSRYTRKWTINDKGLIEPISQEIESVPGLRSTTGSAIAPVAPSNNTGVDKENDLRVKGIQCDMDILFDQFSATLNPYVGIVTDNLTPTLNRVWIPDKVSLNYRDNEIRVFASAYSPLKPKYRDKPPPQPVVVDAAFPIADEVPRNPNGKTVNQIMIEQYNRRRGFSSRSGPGGGNVACVWAINRLFSWGGITPLWGSALAVFQCINAMRASPNGRRINVGSEQPGDFTMVLRPNGFSGHIGLVIGRGRAISNSSSRAAFVWQSDLFFSSAYGNASTRQIWRDIRTF